MLCMLYSHDRPFSGSVALCLVSTFAVAEMRYSMSQVLILLLRVPFPDSVLQRWEQAVPCHGLMPLILTCVIYFYAIAFMYLQGILKCYLRRPVLYWQKSSHNNVIYVTTLLAVFLVSLMCILGCCRICNVCVCVSVRYCLYIPCVAFLLVQSRLISGCGTF